MMSVAVFGELTARERAMVVRYCARHTGEPGVAEDLAQQALLEAWRKANALYGPEAREAWLLGIARNVCLRWERQRGATAARLASPAEPLVEPADDVDLEVELERDELTDLLDRALALLPPTTRAVLVARYIEETPQAAVAARLGLTEGAVEARVQRGKLALRRVLTTDLRADAAAYGIIQDEGGWQETRIWCPNCGQRKLLGRFVGRDLQLDCPSCLDGRRAVQVRSWLVERAEGRPLAELFAGVKGYKPALNRVLAHGDDFYQHGIAGLTARCVWCGTPAPLRTSSQLCGGYRDVRTVCPRCWRSTGITTTNAIAFEKPAARRFWQRHQRIRLLPGQEVEAAGVPAIVARFESVTSQARLTIVLARETLEVLGVHETA